MYPIYIHDSGETYCPRHLPATASGEVKAHPHTREVWTPRGTWEGFTLTEVNLHGLICEKCAHEPVTA